MIGRRIRLGRHSFIAAPASDEELPGLRAYIVAEVGPVTPLAEMARLTLRNEDWLHAVRRVGYSGYAGAFAILPLGGAASEAFGRNAMTGAQITVEHIAENREETRSVYLGSILSGPERLGRAATLAAFNAVAAEYGDVPFYSRPVSKDGLRVLTRLGYRPVEDRPHSLGEMIYRLR